jgi:hypothetical protein
LMICKAAATNPGLCCCQQESTTVTSRSVYFNKLPVF